MGVARLHSVVPQGGVMASLVSSLGCFIGLWLLLYFMSFFNLSHYFISVHRVALFVKQSESLFQEYICA
jgi:hypothetical protein